MLIFSIVVLTLAYFQGPSSQWVDVMKKKRAIHDGIINSVQQQRDSKPSEEVEVWFYFHFLSVNERSR